MDRLADVLEALCRGAQDRLVLVAPFAKQTVVESLLDAPPAGVQVTLVVRWLPHEIKAGVSDIEVWDTVRERERTDLFVRQDLHAKYYRADDWCLVGSANLTAAALGLSPAPNLELLVPVARADAAVAGFEDEVFSAAVEVDEELVALTRSAVEQLPSFLAVEPGEPLARRDRAAPPLPPLQTWVPMLRQPEDLYLAYMGDEDDISAVARGSAAADLAALRVPPGLDESSFRAYVGAALLHMPVVVAVDRFVREPRRFGEVRDFLQQRLQSNEPANRQWQVLFRWLTHFLPDRFEYRRPRHSELIARRADP